jgi:hypothetical protein
VQDEVEEQLGRDRLRALYDELAELSETVNGNAVPREPSSLPS